MIHTCTNALLTVPAMLAQADGGADPNAPAAGLGQGIPTVRELFETSLVINGTNLGLSLIAVGLFVFLLAWLTGAAFAPARFIDDVTRLILNRRFDQALNVCQNHHRLFASSIIQRLVENRDKDHGELMAILQAEGARRADRVWNRIGYLAEIAAIAPTIGLLGTVIGMIRVFFTLAGPMAGPNIDRMSTGIAEALGTTMFGLIVAIVAGLFYLVARGRATAVLGDAEAVCHTVADHIHRAANGQARDAAGPAAAAPGGGRHEEDMP